MLSKSILVILLSINCILSYGIIDSDTTINEAQYKICETCYVEYDNLIYHGLAFPNMDSLSDGNWIVLYKESRKVFCYGSIKNGKRDGNWHYYYPNLQLAQIDQYKDGSLYGKLKTYHSNGEIRSKTSWRNKVPDGRWKYWDMEGELIKEQVWKAGILRKEITYPNTKYLKRR